VVGYAVTDALELVFDTLDVTRKAANLRRDPRIAVVIGWDEVADERTLQLEGIADEPTGEERARLVATYLEKFPDGLQRQQWPGLIYVRVRPTWLRYSDYRPASAGVSELDEAGLARLLAESGAPR
jgi:hypothetical protein